MVGATTVVPPTNETGVCEETICSKLEYYDKLKQKCRDFPGGGFLVIMDHSTKCANGDSGLHTFSRRDFYYVCHPDGVMIGVCPDNTVFSDTEKRCIGETLNQPNTIKVHDESQNCNIIVPDCSGVGLFPIPSNCSFYFKCQEYNYNFHQYVYQCPPGTFFHPDLQKCSSTNKCYEAQEEILHNFSKEYFPECLIYGQFRTAKDCTLYYRCVPNIDGSFYQIRYECPYKMSYNIEKELCVPEHLQCCEYIPHERIIEQYKVQHSIDSTTLLPQPTTVISAINTKITSSIPMYYDTTQPLPLDDALSLVRETSASYATTTTQAVSDEDAVIMNVTPDYDDYAYELDDNDTSQAPYASEEPAEQIYSTPAYSEEALTTIEEYAHESSIEPGSYTSDSDTAPMSSDKPRSTSHPGYDFLEWDDDAWDIPDRVRATQTPPTTTLYDEEITNYDGTESNVDAYSTEGITDSPDHYPTSEPYVNPASLAPYDGLESEMLSYGTGVNQKEESSYVTTSPELEETVSEYYTNQSATAEQTYDSQTEAADRYTEEAISPMNTEPAIEINCTNDKDGEIVCNGQKLSVNGYLELLGYALQLTKWQDLPDEPTTALKPNLKFHLTLEYPCNYIFKAQAIDYRTSYSYELTSSAATEPTTEEMRTSNNE
uniref:uncharacterized protein LOC120961456 n=1 Tax=Anopheles coluzzii TaxID=1518534 RepID=UPI0020FFE26B|nr:uncharacterized protein LOC120961456 [Anopheles coluzzii]